MSTTNIRNTTNVREVASLLEHFHVLFVERNGCLIGSVTNGDFRRGIAAGHGLDEAAEQIMNPNPVRVAQEDGYKTRLALISQLPKGLRYLPVVDTTGRILDVVSDRALIRLPNRAVVMAGGLGTRLKALTADTPKPMLKVGEKPILQLIIEQFRRFGISEITLSVKYKAEIIKSYFADGREFDVKINYLHETERMGTAGCLSLLAKTFTDPFFVMNGDVLTDLNFHDVLLHHRKVDAVATVCAYPYQSHLAYGVLEMEGTKLRRIVEKPTKTVLINAGVYLLEPACLDFVPRGGYLDMPSLIQQIADSGKSVASYRIDGLWIDIGDVDDFHRANLEVRKIPTFE